MVQTSKDGFKEFIMYIIKGLLNIIAGILICFVKSPFDNEVLNICVSLLFYINGILIIRKTIKN